MLGEAASPSGLGADAMGGSATGGWSAKRSLATGLVLLVLGLTVGAISIHRLCGERERERRLRADADEEEEDFNDLPPASGGRQSRIVGEVRISSKRRPNADERLNLMGGGAEEEPYDDDEIITARL